MRAVIVVGMLSLVSAWGCGSEDNPGGAGAGGAGSVFPEVSDFAAEGPYPGGSTLVTTDLCEISYPPTLADSTLKHPVILWGNGTTAQPSFYRAVLTHWASHGFIVGAALTSNAGSGTEMIACLDFLIAENERSGSVFEGKVDTARVGASGHSQGGGGALMVGRDERVMVTAPLQPYISMVPGGGVFDRASITEQHGPMFMMSGTGDFIAAPAQNQQPVFDTTNVPVFWGNLMGADHLGSALGDITGYRGPATAWFRYHLMGDSSARAMFYGEDCTLCTDPQWIVQTKGIN